MVHPLASLPLVEGEQHPELSVKTIQRATSILRCFTVESPEMGLTVISQRTGLHKSTVSRLLLALQREGFAQQNPETGKWQLGLGLLNLAGVILAHMDLRTVAREYLRDLAMETQENVNITIRDGDEGVIMEFLPSTKPIRYAGRLGQRIPLQSTSTGKVLLTFLPNPERKKILGRSGSASFRSNQKALKDTLDQVREQGYAISHEEFEEGLSEIAAPIQDHTGQIIAAVGVSGPTYRMGSGQIEKFAGPLLKAAGGISEKLGFASR